MVVNSQQCARHVPGRTNLLPIRSSSSFVAAITDALSKTWVKCDYWSGNPLCSLPLPLFGSKEPLFFFLSLPLNSMQLIDYSTALFFSWMRRLLRAFAPRKTEIIAHLARVWLQDSGAAVRACVRACRLKVIMHVCGRWDRPGQLAAPNPNHWATTQLMIRCV